MPSKTDPHKNSPLCSGRFLSVAILIAAMSSFLILPLRNDGPVDDRSPAVPTDDASVGTGSPAVPTDDASMGTGSPAETGAVLKELSLLAYKGNLKAVQSLIKRHNIKWSSLSLLGDLQTPIHSALQGRHDSLSRQSSNLIGQHEEVIDYLTAVHFNASHGCPVYYAMHFRNIRALEILLQTADVNSSLACLTTLDSTGETALHSATKSKASGFARFFAKLGTGEALGPEVMDLLGLTSLKIQDSGVMTLLDLNTVITHRDIQLVLEHLQPVLNVATLLDYQGNTLLHNAVYGGRRDLAEVLLDAGVPVNHRNDLGVTPLHLAHAGHFHEVVELLVSHGAKPDIADSANRTPAEVVSYSHEPCNLQSECQGEADITCHPDSLQPMLWERYVDSGWTTDSLPLLNSCGIDIRNSSLTQRELMLDYNGINKPLLIQGLVDSWPAWQHWTKEQLVKRYGHLKFTVSDIPYADLYHGTSAKTTETSLADFIGQFHRNIEYPTYIFDGRILYRNLLLAQDVPIPSLFNSVAITLRQFIVGPRSSGSPPHFHRHAFNVLVYGVKKWYLWPPNTAYFAFNHVKEWEEGFLRGRHNDPAAVVCVQRPGDVVYVPENWGHAVVNLEDSVAVAFEFT